MIDIGIDMPDVSVRNVVRDFEMQVDGSTMRSKMCGCQCKYHILIMAGAR